MTQNSYDPSALLSARTTAIEEAGIIRMSQKARDLAAEGRTIVSLTLGEPDFDTPAAIRKAAIEAMEAGYTHYGPVPGYPELREAIAEKLRVENGLAYDAGDVVVTNGAKQALADAIYALVDEGDEVIVLAPYWASYAGIIKMAGGRVVEVASTIGDDFKAPPERIADAITPRTKAILMNSPCNPSGAVYSRAELEALAEVVRAHPHLCIIADEIYEYIVFEGEHVSIGTLEGMAERTITVNGLSKSFAMTGWRLGYLAAPTPIAKAASKVQGTFTSAANSFVQRAAIAALKGDRTACEEMRETYRKRRDAVMARLAACPGIETMTPPGTFYVFPDVSALLGREIDGRVLADTDAFCDWLLEAHGLATVPGSAFGDARCVRLSFAASDTQLDDGLSRFEAALQALS